MINKHVIIYEKENFEGKVILDYRGPKLLIIVYGNDPRYSHCNTDIFPDKDLQKNFPIECRIWSESDMHQWSYGSVKFYQIYEMNVIFCFLNFNFSFFIKGLLTVKYFHDEAYTK